MRLRQRAAQQLLDWEGETGRMSHATPPVHNAAIRRDQKCSGNWATWPQRREDGIPVPACMQNSMHRASKVRIELRGGCDPDLWNSKAAGQPSSLPTDAQGRRGLG